MNTVASIGRLAVLTYILMAWVPTVARGQALEVLHSFRGCLLDDGSTGDCSLENPDGGAQPRGTLVQDSDAYFYGTTFGNSVGTVFKVAPNGDFATIFRFLHPNPPSATLNGTFPVGGLVKGSDGAFYGGTDSGGAYGDGVLFKIATDGTFTKLHDFDLDGNASNNGGGPWGGLVFGVDGLLYGTTQYGGGPSGYGTIFRVNGDGTITTLHSFSGTDGQWPQGDLMLASDGNIYGTTSRGGGGGVLNCGDNGCGTVFRVVLPGGSLETVHAFDFTDGAGPREGRLTESGGKLYGLTSEAGDAQSSNGTLFSIDLTTQDFSLLHSFIPSEAISTRGTLAVDADGNLYGAASGAALNDGTVFQVTPSGDVIVLHNFNGADGEAPVGGVILGNDGNLYGTTMNGGAHGFGVVFRVVLPTGNQTPIANNGTLSAKEDRSANGRLTGSDPDGQPITFSIVSTPSKGAVSLNTTTGRFTYSPQPNANGADTFTFRVSDGIAFSNAATVSVTIAPVNDTPVATSASFTTQVGQPVNESLQATDVDGDALTFSVARAPRRGTLTVSPAGAFTYTPSPGFVGSDSFRFRATDPSGASSMATINITVTP